METDWCQQLTEGLVENGCQYLSIALMESAQEVQKKASAIADRLKFPLLAEQTTSEKIGYEIALTYSYGKKRSAFLTHGFSLPVAMDPLMSSIYTGVAGGFLVITLDTTPPLPYSSGCDPVSLGMFAKMAVLEASGFDELPALMKSAYALSEKFETPVMLHIDTKIPKGSGSVTWKTGKRRRTDFEKNPARWAATPRFRFLLHQKLNRRLREIAESAGKEMFQKLDGNGEDLGIICNPANLRGVQAWARKNGAAVLSPRMLYPLPLKPLEQFIRTYKKTVIIEDRFPTMQFQLPERKKIPGRWTSEAFREVASWDRDQLNRLLEGVKSGKDIQAEAAASPPQRDKESAKASALAAFLNKLRASSRPPLLIADKTPLTTGLPVDHFVSRGGAISVLAGHAHATEGEETQPVLGITDSSAFLHYGIQAMTNAIYNTASVKCLMVTRPEHENVIRAFLDAMNHVQVIPLNPQAKNARQKVFREQTRPITFFTVPMEVPV